MKRTTRRVKPFRLSRRAMLRGLGGAAVALPALEMMLDGNGEALADGTPLPKRFVIFCFGNGIIKSRWLPAQTGASWELSQQLAPLAPVKDYVTVVSGTKNAAAGTFQHHGGMHGLWAARPTNGSLTATGPTIDQIVADTLSVGAPIRSLEIGISKRGDSGTNSTLTHFLSHRSASQPLPPQCSPKALFNSMFSTELPEERQARASLLDLVSTDAKRLRQRLGSTDRIRLDAHLTGIEELQARIAALPAALGIEEPTQENIDVAGREPIQEVADAMNELLTVAFACDLTRVASVLLTVGQGSTHYSHLGQFFEQHLASHDYVTALELLHVGHVWNYKTFSELLQSLAASPEGATNVLAQTVAICGTDVTEGWDHGTTDMPLVIAGGGGGSLVNPGIHYRATGDRNLSDALLAAMQAVVPSITSVGAEAGYSETPITEILTSS